MQVLNILFALLLILLFLPIVLYYCGHPVLVFLYLLLLIVLLPTVLFHHEIICRIPPYLNEKQGQYTYFKQGISDLLRRHFKVHIQKEANIEGPVIYVINHHEPGSYLDHFALMLIEKRAKIVMYQRRGMVGRLFRNIEYIGLDKGTNNRLPDFLEKCQKELDKGTSIVVYPEGKHAQKKTFWRQLVEFQSGAFILSRQANIPIVPVLISGGQYKNGLVRYQPIKLRYLAAIRPGDFETVDEMKNYTYQAMNRGLKTL